MRYGIGSLRDNQRTRSYLIWINCVWKESVDNEALVVWPSRDFRATTYKFRAFLSRNECLGNLKNLLNQKVTLIFEVSQT